MTDDQRAPHVKPWNFSATAAELWNACPFAFSMKYEQGVEEVRGRPLRIGALLAMTVEKYLTHCADKKVATDVSAFEWVAREVYAEQGVGLGLDALDEVLRIGTFYVQQHTLDLEHLVGVEVWLPPKGGEDLLIAGRRVVGKLDELYMDDVGTTATVVDAKTNWAVWSERDTRAKLQARLYPILVMHSFPDVDEVRVVFDFVRHGAVREVRWTRGEIEVERDNLEALAVQMQKPGVRPATPGDHCGICGYVSRCPVFRTARTSGVFVIPTNDEEAEKVVETLLVLEAGVKQRKDALRAYTAGVGPIEVNGVRVGHFTSEKPRVPTKAFVDWCAEDLDPYEWLELPTDAVRKLLRRRKSLAELVRPEISTRFATKRGEENEEEAVAS